MESLQDLRKVLETEAKTPVDSSKAVTDSTTAEESGRFQSVAERPGIGRVQEEPIPTAMALTQQVAFIMRCRDQWRGLSETERPALLALVAEAAERVSKWLTENTPWTRAFLARLGPTALDALGFALEQVQLQKGQLVGNSATVIRAVPSQVAVSAINQASAKLVQCLDSDQATWHLPAVRLSCRRWLMQASSAELRALTPSLRDRVALEVHQVLRETLSKHFKNGSRRAARSASDSVGDLGLPDTPSWTIVSKWWRTRGTVISMATLEMLCEAILQRQAIDHEHESLLLLLQMSMQHPHAADDRGHNLSKRWLHLGAQVLGYLQARAHMPGRVLLLWADCLTTTIESYMKNVASESSSMAAPEPGLDVDACSALLRGSIDWLRRTVCFQMGHPLRAKALMALLSRLLSFLDPESAAQILEQFLDPAMELLWPSLDVVFGAFIASHARMHAQASKPIDPHNPTYFLENAYPFWSDSMSQQMAGCLEQDTETWLAAAGHRLWIAAASDSAPCMQIDRGTSGAPDGDTCPWRIATHRLMALLLARYDEWVRARGAKLDSTLAMRALLVIAVRALGSAAFLSRHGDCRSFFPWLLPILRYALDCSSLQAYISWAECWDERLIHEKALTREPDEILHLERLRYQLWLIGPTACRAAVEFRESGHWALWNAILQRLLLWLRSSTSEPVDADTMATTQHTATVDDGLRWQLLACHFLSVLCQHFEKSVIAEFDTTTDAGTERRQFRALVEALLQTLFQSVCEETAARRAPFLEALTCASARLATSAERVHYFDQARERLMQLEAQPAGRATTEAIALLFEIMTALVDSETAPLLFDATKAYLGSHTSLQVQKRAYRAFARVADLISCTREMQTALVSTYRQSHSAAEALRLACIYQYFRRMDNEREARSSETAEPGVGSEAMMVYEVVFGLRATASRARTWARATLRLLVDQRLQQERPAPSQRLVALLVAGLLAENASAVASCLDGISLTTIRVRQALRTGKHQSSSMSPTLAQDLERAFWEPLRAMLHREQTAIVTNALLRVWKHGIPFLFRDMTAQNAPAAANPTGEQARAQPLLHSLGQALDRLVTHGASNARTAHEIRGVVTRLAKRCPPGVLESLFRSAPMRAVLQSAQKNLRRLRRKHVRLGESVAPELSLPGPRIPSIRIGAMEPRSRNEGGKRNRSRATSAELVDVHRNAARSSDGPGTMVDSSRNANRTWSVMNRGASMSFARNLDTGLAATRRKNFLQRSLSPNTHGARERHRASKNGNGHRVHRGGRLEDPDLASLYWDESGRLHVLDESHLEVTDRVEASHRRPSLKSSAETETSPDVSAECDEEANSRRQSRTRKAAAPRARLRAGHAQGDHLRAVYRNGERVLVEPYAYVPLHGERRLSSKRKVAEVGMNPGEALRELVRPNREHTKNAKRKRGH
jgi:hypothetical protein